MGDPLYPASRLDGNQVLTHAFNEQTQRLRTDAEATIVNADIDVQLDSSNDSVAIGDINGNLATVTNDGLNVNILDAVDLDIRDLSHVTDSIKIGDGTDFLLVNTDGSLNSVVTGKTIDLSGTASANNVNIISDIDVSGYDTITIHNTGTYSLTAQAQFSNNGVTWVAVLGQSMSAAGTAPSTTVSVTNTIYKVPISGRFFRYRTTAYVSGTITANLSVTVHDINDFGSRNNTISGTVATTGTISAANITVTGTGAAVNATPIAATVVGQYDVATIALTGTWAASLVAEGSNNNVDWFNIPVQLINSISALPQLTITSTGLYKVPLQFNNFRLRVSSFTSGTVAANARISSIDSEGLSPKVTVLAGNLVNTFNEVLSVASGVLTTIASFTATQATRLTQVEVSGDNIAEYEVLVNGSVVSKKRTYFGGQLDGSFLFDKGITVTSGQQVLVRVLHNRPSLARFNSNILVIEG